MTGAFVADEYHFNDVRRNKLILLAFSDIIEDRISRSFPEESFAARRKSK